MKYLTWVLAFVEAVTIVLNTNQRSYLCVEVVLFAIVVGGIECVIQAKRLLAHSILQKIKAYVVWRCILQGCKTAILVATILPVAVIICEVSDLFRCNCELVEPPEAILLNLGRVYI